jgi:tetratricopeptide (TPR) repeat protein
MQANYFKAWVLAILMILGACATTKNPYYDTPPSQLLKEDQRKFLQALEAQQKGQIPLAVDLWQKFVKEHPRSYEAHNNLGMTLYANDQLGLALEELHKAHELEPSDTKIKENLVRTLKFHTALLVENKEYERAIENWGLISELSPDEKEKISYKIEELEDRIFEQVKRSNTLEDYKSFLERYPESSNAEAARKRLEELGRARITTPDPITAEPPATPVTTADKPAEMATPIAIAICCL